MLKIEDFLGYVKNQKFYDKQIVHIEEFPPKPAEFGGLDIPLHDSLMNWIIKKNFRLWSHQAEAINNVLKGENLVIATSTSSGKSLCYNLPVLNSILNGPNNTALYLFPRKALTQDQYTELTKIIEEVELDKDLVGIYDGDTPSDVKRQIRQNANIVMTNPYALHRYLPFFPKLWQRICKNLKYVIIDEVHLYKGVFGTNVALLLRRLKRLLRIYNIYPQWILCSATINDPKGFAEKLVGEQFELVDDDGSPSGAKKVILWDLPYDDLKNEYRSGNTESQYLFKCHLERGIQTLMFTTSRKLAELQASWAKSELLGIRNRISTYRAGLSKQDRREIELGLKSKKLLGVCSTNALELGIDIGTLEATITSGFPMTISSFKQQIGRSGRGKEISISTLIPQANPLDFFYIHNPKVLFGPIQEKLLINLNNKEILKKQIRCAAYENPVKETEHLNFGIEDEALFKGCLEELVSNAIVLRNDKYYSLEKNPAMKIGIGNLSDISYNIYIKTKLDNRRIFLTTDDEEHVYRDTHPGAIYLYNAKQYLVEEVDFEKKDVLLTKVNTNYFTIAIYSSEIKRLKEISQKKLQNNQKTIISQGRINVKQTFHSFNKLQNITQDLIGSEDLIMPNLRFNTQAMWILLPDEYLKILRDKNFNVEGSLHAIVHSLIHMVPLLAQIDRYDIDGTFVEEDLEYGQTVIYIFDAFRDGVGIAERVYEKISELLTMAQDLLKSCPCTSKKGCPGCVMATHCVDMNDPLDKKGALALLELLSEGDTEIEKIKQIDLPPKVEHENISNATKPPVQCPKCGKKIAMWDGKYGLFYGCRGYPSCKYTLNINKVEKIICPLCGSIMENRTGSHGEFMGCKSFPQCRFTFQIFKKKEK